MLILTIPCFQFFRADFESRRFNHRRAAKSTGDSDLG